MTLITGSKKIRHRHSCEKAHREGRCRYLNADNIVNRTWFRASLNLWFNWPMTEPVVFWLLFCFLWNFSCWWYFVVVFIAIVVLEHFVLFCLFLFGILRQDFSMYFSLILYLWWRSSYLSLPIYTYLLYTMTVFIMVSGNILFLINDSKLSVFMPN